MAKSKFHLVTYIRTTPEKLWDALINPTMTRLYWAETWQDCTWKPGASWKLMSPDGKFRDAGEIIEITPPRRLALTWQNQYKPEMKAEGFSKLTYEIDKQIESTKFSLTHEIDVADSKLIAAVATGWPWIISSLKSLLETGESLVETRKWPEGE